LFVSWHSWPQHILSKTIKECIRKKEKLRFGISYLICVPRVKSRRVDGPPHPLLRVVVHPPRCPAAPAGLLLLISENWPPLVVNEASRGTDGEEGEKTNPSHTTSIMGSYHSLWFCPSGINNEVLNHLSCSLGRQQVSGENYPSSPLILKLTLLRCL
jgi:hypothetical protein